MNELDRWVEAACGELGLAPGDVEAGAVLDVARDVAHQVLRPGAPVTAYLMGIAVGRGADPAEAAARISALARAWPARTEAKEEASQAAKQAASEEAAQAARQAASQAAKQAASEEAAQAARQAASAGAKEDVS